jgi:hypothetical protein
MSCLDFPDLQLAQPWIVCETPLRAFRVYPIDRTFPTWPKMIALLFLRASWVTFLMERFHHDCLSLESTRGSDTALPWKAPIGHLRTTLLCLDETWLHETGCGIASDDLGCRNGSGSEGCRTAKNIRFAGMPLDNCL